VADSRVPDAAAARRKRGSLRGQLLRWLLIPLAVLVALNAVSAWHSALDAVNLAYDRTLLAAARAIAERISMVDGRVTVDVPYVALDFVQSDIPGRIYYKVSGPHGEFVSGYDDFPAMPPGVPRSPLYPALVHFYDGHYHANPLRVAALFQPVSDGHDSGIALIQVGETPGAREMLARALLIDTIWQQGLLVAVTAILMLLAVTLALRPLRRLRDQLAARAPGELTPFAKNQVHNEVRPLVTALNDYVRRLAALVAGQRRFIADASHQLRTPLTVLKTEAELALREKDPQAMREIVAAFHHTTDQTIRLANQLLSLAHAEPGAAAPTLQSADLRAAARQTCLDHAPQAVAKRIDLGFDDRGLPAESHIEIMADPLLLHELLANLLDNALRYTAAGGTVTVRVGAAETSSAVQLEIEDNGPGIAPELREKVFDRFYRVPDNTLPGAGLGLAIVGEICATHNARITLSEGAGGKGLRVAIRFPQTSIQSNRGSD
jgi:two-component system sensor histidine kinase TctE